MYIYAKAINNIQSQSQSRTRGEKGEGEKRGGKRGKISTYSIPFISGNQCVWSVIVMVM